MRRDTNITYNIDWLILFIYSTLVIMGWLNIYASVYEGGTGMNIFDFSLNSGKQLIWIASTLIIFSIIMSIDFKFYESVSYLIYGLILFMLLFVLVFGTKVSGARSWFEIGSFFKIQPSEFAKFATALAIAKYASQPTFRFSNMSHLLTIFALILGPMLLILLQPDAGTALIFISFIIVFYREGLTPYVLIIGIFFVFLFILTMFIDQLYIILGIGLFTAIAIGFAEKTFKKAVGILIIAVMTLGVTLSFDYFQTNILKPHHQKRLMVLINPNSDPLGDGWNVTQSKIAIGSGRIWGKGFLQGTQTKFDFVPEQSTDFIFCTLGEELGWAGTSVVIIIFIVLILRIIYIAERQKSRFARVYGYGVASILFFHFTINIGMTIGLFPVIGIPLPFLSYGGSSLWGFSILLFILLKLDAHRMQILNR
ncbi:MAG: rod shape-determining protein RodA [Cyclobacteriaceae bacterium]|nr:rod shape-determining protein RodA [Cyclobacteriaceae bacterium]